MSPARLAVGAVAVAAVAFLAGTVWPGPVGAVAALVVAGLAATTAVAVQRRRVRRITGRISAWLSDADHEPVRPAGGRDWEALGDSLDALAAAYHRRGAELEREQPWRSKLIDALVQPALLFSADGRLLAANDAARELLRIPRGARDLTVVEAVGNPTLARAVHDANRSGTAVTVDADDGDQVLRAVVSLLGDQLLMIITDRTRERRIEELRRNFVVNASHELKTPVTSIRTLAEALEVVVVSDPERVGPLVKRLGDEAERLAQLVHDLLDLRRLEDREPVEAAPVDVAELSRRVVAGLLHRAEARDVDLYVEAPDRAVVLGVAADLETAIKNLVANAIQYNRPGGTVEVRIEPGDGCQVVSVRDTGIGIPREDLRRIFERFYRVDTARSRETGGTGLGLSIVRHAVERHGGTIRVDSVLEEGSTFTIRLPVPSTPS